MERNIDQYCLLATKQLKTIQEIKEKGPQKAFMAGIFAICLLVLQILTKLPFLTTLLALSFILYPASKKIYLKAQNNLVEQ
jgi:hypothetical protein